MVMRPIKSNKVVKQEEIINDNTEEQIGAEVMIVAFHVDTWKEVCRLAEMAGVTQGEIISDAISLLRDKMGAE